MLTLQHRNYPTTGIQGQNPDTEFWCASRCQTAISSPFYSDWSNGNIQRRSAQTFSLNASQLTLYRVRSGQLLRSDLIRPLGSYPVTRSRQQCHARSRSLSASARPACRRPAAPVESRGCRFVVAPGP